MSPNKYGLSKDISKPVEREIRQQAGFGCVICGNALCDYHHFDPPFNEATTHNSSGITLLCDKCHGMHNRKRLSDEKIKAAANNPYCLTQGAAHWQLETVETGLEIILGDTNILNVKILLEIYGEPIIQIEPPEALGGPLRLSAKFYDISDNPICVINRNIVEVPNSNWDVEFKGPTVIIRKDRRNICLIMRVEPPNRIIIERLAIRYKNVTVTGNKEGVVLDSLGERRIGPVRLKSITIKDARVAIRITHDPIAPIGIGSN